MSDGSDSDDLLQRAAAMQKQKQQQQQGSKGKVKGKQQQQAYREEEEQQKETAKQKQQVKQNKQRQPPPSPAVTSPPTPSAAADSSSSSAAVVGNRPPKSRRVPIKVEHARATRQADIDSGVAGALRTLAMKKKQKLLQKKNKGKKAAEDDDDDEDESNDEEEDNQKAPRDEDNEEEEEEDQSDDGSQDCSPEASPSSSHSHGSSATATAASASPAATDPNADADADFVLVAPPTEDLDDAFLDPTESLALYRETHDIHLSSLDESLLPSSSLDSNADLLPIISFSALEEEFQLPSLLVAAATSRFTTPTPIQAQCWPLLLGGYDVIGTSATGSGKSLAFLLPAIYFLLQQREREAKKATATNVSSSSSSSSSSSLSAPSSSSSQKLLTPRVLVLAPTRELAMQTSKVAAEILGKISPTWDRGGTKDQALSPSSSSGAATSAATTASTSSSPDSASWLTPTPLISYVLFGGTALDIQLASLRTLPSLDLLVATPGRLVKHLTGSGEETTAAASSTPTFTLQKCGFLVIDEADQLLDLGFQSELTTLQQHLPTKRQTCLFSATWDSTTQSKARSFGWLARGAEKTVLVHAGRENAETLQANKNITQIVELIDRRAGKRERRLIELLQKYHQPTGRTNRIIIFVLYKQEAKQVAEFLQREGWAAQGLSGDFSQTHRLQALNQFRQGTIPILVATDVAARGLDVQNITHVINFSVGLSIEQYVHRIGRCGRAGATGLAHTFIVDYDASLTPALVQLLQEAQQIIPPELKEVAGRAERQAAKHAHEPTAALRGDAYYAALKAGTLTKNVNKAKEIAKQLEEDEIEKAIFGEDSGEGVLQKGKKIHPSQLQGKRQHGYGHGGGKGGHKKR